MSLSAVDTHRGFHPVTDEAPADAYESFGSFRDEKALTATAAQMRQLELAQPFADSRCGGAGGVHDFHACSEDLLEQPAQQGIMSTAQQQGVDTTLFETLEIEGDSSFRDLVFGPALFYQRHQQRAC